MSTSTPSRNNQAPKLERSLNSLETGTFGLSGSLIWLGTAASMHFALGGKEIWVCEWSFIKLYYSSF
ncbi:MAG: hypothetical protein KME29_22510 [Calothrix sp. FI2-JRJ7]|jgi:hypothetical protein|nr:hypothetical protein [Calothrix sp. FI2-JRJ7]